MDNWHILCLLSVLVSCVSSCTVTAEPPKFTLGHPPLPPGSRLELQCEVETKKTALLGLVLSVVFGVLLIVVAVFLYTILKKKQQIKYKIGKGSDNEPKPKLAEKATGPGWSWKPNCKLANFFKGIQRNPGSVSSTSSESGYCEEVFEQIDKTFGDSKKKVVMRRPPGSRQRPTSSRSTAVTDTTPDIIASTQSDPLEDDGTPKRWSLFGLLPSLKPLLVYRPDESDEKLQELAKQDDFQWKVPDDKLKLKTEKKNEEEERYVTAPIPVKHIPRRDSPVPPLYSGRMSASAPGNVQKKNSKIYIPIRDARTKVDV